MRKLSVIAFISVSFFLLNPILSQQAKKQNQSEWVYPGSNEKLIYKTTPAGDKIMDFSHAGYMGGGIALPKVHVKKIIKPSGISDDTELIQKAVDEVSALEIENGFRGTVLLAEGTFICSGTINIDSSGVVVSGSGVNETIIKMTGEKHSAFVINNRNIKKEKNEEGRGSLETFISDSYVPAGALEFNVEDASTFQVGDIIEIKRPVTKEWVEFMQMHNMIRNGKPETWLGTDRYLLMKRTITDISGKTITVDVPLSDSFDAQYLNPPGIIVSKISQFSETHNVGIENLHVQCPALEVAFTKAPYSGVKINGDDCWIRNVFFDETMNTVALRGDRITIQNVDIKRTYTNLGAAKPADFDIQGSQILIDRCNVTAGNTYFVWVGALIPGPNVVLNSTFHGYGSRIQPHQRWSTGMLVDNCTVPDGGIDYPNRGVAGSGHGWTMGWAVVWNSIAKSFIVQNPPGTLNWAIGCIGERVKTARYFDTAPILDEGVFDSHGTPVVPQSLYLAQLQERLGKQALINIGYETNDISMFTNKSVEPLPAYEADIDKELGENLGLYRPVNASNTREGKNEFGGEKAVDGNNETYWALDDDKNNETLIIDTEGPIDINTVILGEAEGFQNRVLEYKVEGQVNSDWKLLSEGTSIGERKVDKFPTETVWKVRLTILKADSYPAINNLGLYLHN